MTNTSILMEGLKGEPVKLLQAKLGVSADGIFGPATEKALKEYQQQHGLAVDGIAGPQTLAKLNLFGVTPSAVAASVAEAGKSIWDSVSESKDGALSKVKSFFGL